MTKKDFKSYKRRASYETCKRGQDPQRRYEAPVLLYKSLEEMLEKYGIRSNSIPSIPQFTQSLTQSMKVLQSLSSA
ncbi:hypothetical protein RCL_jg10097.t1 [Rhizophagus clarus]|uniref:Uncharacterized protein n=1 Tax=Rhizophagus clarus TaxID=94130 RepID=A0A8H3QCT5_9GLOM|nr:hypothetical protein RCL_jg10097.t1 [Rhizophagus clarus]